MHKHASEAQTHRTRTGSDATKAKTLGNSIEATITPKLRGDLNSVLEQLESATAIFIANEQRIVSLNMSLRDSFGRNRAPLLAQRGSLVERNESLQGQIGSLKEVVRRLDGECFNSCFAYCARELLGKESFLEVAHAAVELMESLGVRSAKKSKRRDKSEIGE